MIQILALPVATCSCPKPPGLSLLCNNSNNKILFMVSPSETVLSEVRCDNLYMALRVGASCRSRKQLRLTWTSRVAALMEDWNHWKQCKNECFFQSCTLLKEAGSPLVDENGPMWKVPGLPVYAPIVFCSSLLKLCPCFAGTAHKACIWVFAAASCGMTTASILQAHFVRHYLS